MLGLGGSGIEGEDCNGRFLSRPNGGMAAAVNYGRPQHPYAGKRLHYHISTYYAYFKF